MLKKIRSNIKWVWINGRNLHVIIAGRIFINSLRKDKSFARQYQAVIACCIMDEFKNVRPYKTVGKLDQIAFANNAAKRYLELWLRK